MDNLLTTLRQEEKFSTWVKLGKVALIALYFVLVVVILEHLHLSELQAFLGRNQHLAFGISVLAVAFTSFTLIPTIPLTLFLAVIIGPWPATMATALGNTLTALIHYQVGKQFGDILNFEETKARLPFKLGKLPVHSPLFLLAGRSAPGGPVGLSFICGAYSVPHFIYLWTTFITNFLGAVLVAFSGDLLIKL
jgi:uncharacterized membrane protein YdjX (TVP38/TMEM64 family)